MFHCEEVFPGWHVSLWRGIPWMVKNSWFDSWIIVLHWKLTLIVITGGLLFWIAQQSAVIIVAQQFYLNSKRHGMFLTPNFWLGSYWKLLMRVTTYWLLSEHIVHVKIDIGCSMQCIHYFSILLQFSFLRSNLWNFRVHECYKV